MNEDKIEELAKVLSKQIDKKVFERKSAPVKEVLILVGAGVFLAASVVMPNLPLALKPFLKYREDREEDKIWKKFNIPYLKRTIERLENQKLVEIAVEDGKQTVKITKSGSQKIFKFALDELSIEKPKIWDRKWILVSFDLPETLAGIRKALVEYMRAWKFYPLHKSVYLHAYPCLKEIEFLREYLGIGEYVRIFTVTKIENDKLFKDFFGV